MTNTSTLTLTCIALLLSTEPESVYVARDQQLAVDAYGSTIDDAIAALHDIVDGIRDDPELLAMTPRRDGRSPVQPGRAAVAELAPA